MSDITSFNVAYDRKADTLYISDISRQSSRGAQDSFGIIWRYSPDGHVMGATIMDFVELWQENTEELAVKLADRLDLPVHQAGLVIKRALQLHSKH